MSHAHSFQTRLTAILALVVFSIAVLIPAGASAQAKPNATQSLTTLVQGTIANGGGNFSGVLSITNFVVQNGAIAAVGNLTGTLTDAAGNTIGTIAQSVTVPLAGASGSCQILNLTLGPLDLSLLGLQVHLNQVVLNITAQPGPGNLLGNLLCAVANLLNGGGPLSSLLNGLTALLNQILGAL